MANNKNNNFSIFKYIKELRKTERGKGILFFSFYLVFFLILFLMIAFGGNRTINFEDYEDDYNDKEMYSAEKLLNENYRFIYTIIVDNNVLVYSGEKYKDLELFTVNGINYYRNGDNYFMNNNGVWTVTTNPYIYPDFLNFTRLGEVLVDATYISKTEYGSGRILFNYQISSSSLIKKIEDIDTDIMKIPNRVVFTADSELSLNKAELDLSRYGIYKGICVNNFKIILEYSSIGEVEEIVNPLG